MLDWKGMGKMSIIWKAGIMSPGAAGHGFLGSSLCDVLGFTIKAWKEETGTGTAKHITPGFTGTDVCTHRKNPATEKDGIDGVTSYYSEMGCQKA